jgi:hypothetical protein
MLPLTNSVIRDGALQLGLTHQRGAVFSSCSAQEVFERLDGCASLDLCNRRGWCGAESPFGSKPWFIRSSACES